ncbi:MAG: serine/threonine-protein phosphatase [Pseudomonadota bacterium]|nr:serine/threonine-protein phosphatase [Pseudomonadota bacterium]
MADAIIRAAGATHVGLRRERNEDSFLLRPEAGLWAVADGMGGHGGGDVASRIATQALAAFAIGPTGQERLAAFERAVVEANRDIRAYAEERGGAIMGTTLVALLIFGAHFACLWCGDSRAYLLRGGALRQLSRDHSEMQDLVDRGVLDPHEAKSWPRRSVVTRALGAMEPVELDLVSDRIAPGDAFLLCSDGLTAHCGDADIAAALAEPDPQAVCDGLIALTLQRGASDNVSAIALRCEG